jgi:hypothetical protein
MLWRPYLPSPLAQVNIVCLWNYLVQAGRNHWEGSTYEFSDSRHNVHVLCIGFAFKEVYARRGMLYNHWWSLIVVMCQRKDVAHEQIEVCDPVSTGKHTMPYLYSVAHDMDTLGCSLFLLHWHIIKVTLDECSSAGQISRMRSVACLAQKERYQVPHLQDMCISIWQNSLFLLWMS